MEWNPGIYLKFRDQRTRPARDLLDRVQLDSPARVLDVGCGPGNSTRLLAERWPGAETIGIDSSEAMIRQAGEEQPEGKWLVLDAAGELSALGRFDVVFSNAALQWMPDHEGLLARLFALVNDGGVLAVQVPNNDGSPLHTAVRRTVESAAWRERIPTRSRQVFDSAETYYRLLSPLTGVVDLWETIYYHVMNSHADLLEWIRGTHLRQYLSQLPDAAAREDFEGGIMRIAAGQYPVQANGKILYPFRRLFFIAEKR